MYCCRQTLALLISAWTQSIASNPLTTPSDNHALQPPNLPASITNLSVPDIPPTFKIRTMMYLPSRDPPPEAYFRNAMTAMQEAALGNFDGTMPLENFCSSRFPRPVIRAVTPGGVPIGRKYMVWGLYLALAYMQEENRFGISVFGLEYGPNQLGIIGFGGPPVGAASDNLARGMVAPVQPVLVGLNAQTGAVEITKTSPRADSNANHLLTSWASTAIYKNITNAAPSIPISTLTKATTLGAELDVKFTYTGPTFDKLTLLYTLLNAIADTAPRPHDAVVFAPWVSHLEGEDCQVFFKDVIPSQTEEPDFLYEDIAGALVKAADWIIGRRRYGAFIMFVDVDEVTVAEGGVRLLAGDVGGIKGVT